MITSGLRFFKLCTTCDWAGWGELACVCRACNGVIDGGASYSLNPVQIKPNQCVFYRIIATNEGSEPVNNVVITDTVPAFTNLRVPTIPSVTVGSMDASSASTNGATGALKANVGTLASGASATMQFNIRVQP